VAGPPFWAGGGRGGENFFHRSPNSLSAALRTWSPKAVFILWSSYVHTSCAFFLVFVQKRLMLRKESVEFCHHFCMQLHLNTYCPERLKVSSVSVLNSERNPKSTLALFFFFWDKQSRGSGTHCGSSCTAMCWSPLASSFFFYFGSSLSRLLAPK
jgi:hypothetical protein